jgi:hypothetical protein
VSLLIQRSLNKSVLGILAFVAPEGDLVVIGGVTITLAAALGILGAGYALSSIWYCVTN